MHIFDLDAHIGDLFLDQLEVADLLSKLLPGVGIGHGVGVGGLRHAKVHGRAEQTLGLKVLHQLDPRAVLLAV